MRVSIRKLKLLKKNQAENLEQKNITELKNSLEGFNSRSDQVEEKKISDDRLFKLLSQKNKRKKTEEKWIQSQKQSLNSYEKLLNGPVYALCESQQKRKKKEPRT